MASLQNDVVDASHVHKAWVGDSAGEGPAAVDENRVPRRDEG